MSENSSVTIDRKVRRLCLGTAQFGMDYGVANSRGRIPEDECRQIIESAYAAGVRSLDTAPLYGESEARLGRILKDSGHLFEISSKISLPPSGKNLKRIEETFFRSLRRLETEKIDACLVHHFEDFDREPALYDLLLDLKKKDRLRRIGFSLYQTSHLDRLLEQRIPMDVVQIPYSLFDRRFETYFETLRRQGIAIHARSVFLQGAAFLPPARLPDALRPLVSPLRRIESYCIQKDLKPGDVFLSFVLQNRCIEKTLIGIDSRAQLDDHIRTAGNSDFAGMVLPESLLPEITDENVLLPFRWNIS